MNVLITGSEGLVGRHFVKHLTEEGHNITGIDLKNGMDCREFFDCSKKRFDLVIHLAALVGGRMMIEGQPLAIAQDLSIDAEMFNWALRTRPVKIVYFSSSAAYPTVLQDQRYKYKLKEDDIDLKSVQNPDMLYGWSKLTGEILAGHARDEGLDVYVFRPFSGYAEDQDLDYPFPSFIKRIKNKENPFTIWGNGQQVRDFIHMDDVVGATMKAVELGIHGPVNLGCGRPTSFNELARMMFRISGHSARVEYHGEKPSGVQYRCSDNTKMLEFYRPKVSLEEGIIKALVWGSQSSLPPVID